MSRHGILSNTLIKTACIWAALSAVASPTLALGVGQLSVLSGLGERLNARIPLSDLQGLTKDQIKAQTADDEHYRTLGAERSYQAIRYTVDVRSDTDGEIQLTTEQNISEPFLDLVIEVSWPGGKVLRQYPVLLDP